MKSPATATSTRACIACVLQEFRADIRQAKARIEDVIGDRIIGYRAPTGRRLSRHAPAAFAVDRDATGGRSRPQVPNPMTLRIAFIGAGQMARHHLGAITRLETPAVVVGVYDGAPDRAAEFAALAGARAFPSVQALLAEARPDVVHVCTPPGAHFEAACAALDGGAHVYVEKPFALTVDDARALLDLAHVARAAGVRRASTAVRPCVRDAARARGGAGHAGAGRQPFRVPARRPRSRARCPRGASRDSWSTSCRTRSTR